MRAALIEALQSTACALCQIAQQNNPRYVETLLDEAVIDVEQRDAWRAARGLCNWHAWMAVKTPQAAGNLAILYHDVLGHDLTRTDPVMGTDGDGSQRSAQRRFRRRLRGWLDSWQSSPTCPACRTWKEQERLYVQVLLNDWKEPALAQAFTASVGLCWPHVRRLAAWQPGHENLPAVLKAQRACLENLQRNLELFIRKLDYRFANEPYGREADAWRRAVSLYAGATGWPDSTSP